MKGPAGYNFDELLSAYVDGELTAAETALVERRLREDPEAARALQELRRTVGLVRSLPRHAAPPAILDDIRSRLERADLLDDEVARPRLATASGRRGWRWMAMAASFALVSSAGLWIWWEGRQAANVRPPVAGGPLAELSATAEPSTDAKADRRNGGRSRAEAEPKLAVSAGTEAQEAKVKAKPAVADASDSPPTPFGELQPAGPERAVDTVRVQVAAASEADRRRLISQIEQQISVKAPAATSSQVVSQHPLGGERRMEKKGDTTPSAAEELVVMAPVEVLNEAISQLGDPRMNARSISVQAGTESAEGVAQVQTVLNQVALQNSGQSRQATAGPPDPAFGSGIFRPFLRALGLEGLGATRRLDAVEPGGPADGPARANAAMAVDDESSMADAAEGMQSSTARSQADSKEWRGGARSAAQQEVPPTMVQRGLEAAVRQRIARSQGPGNTVVGPPEASDAAAPQLLTVVFQFLVETPVGTPPASATEAKDAAPELDKARKDPDKPR